MPAKTYRQIACYLMPKAHGALRALSEKSRVPITAYLREAVDDLLAKYSAGNITDAPAPKGKTSNITEEPTPEPESKPDPHARYNFAEADAKRRARDAPRKAREKSTPKAKRAPITAERKAQIQADLKRRFTKAKPLNDTAAVKSTMWFYNKSGLWEARLTVGGYIARRVSDGEFKRVTSTNMFGAWRTKSQMPTKMRNRLRSELHPDKHGRDQTQGERAAYTWLMKRQ
jgi:hypothetical protein